MIDYAIKFLAGEVNNYLLRRTTSQDVKVAVSGLADETGKWGILENSIGLALVNVEEERVLRTQIPERVLKNGTLVMLAPELKLNLQVVFAVRCKQYDQSLRYLSHVLNFFQANSSFTPADFPALDPSFGKLSVELLSYGPEQLNQLWAYIGAKYLPSAVYRVRMVVLQDTEPKAYGKPITEIVIGVTAK